MSLPWSAWVLIAFFGASAAAPVLAPRDPDDVDITRVLDGPAHDHWLGTDQVGRDVFSRVLHGGRQTLALVAAAVAGTLIVGIIVGVVAGYAGGWIDGIVSSVLTMMHSLPSLLLTLALLGVLGPGTSSLLLALIAAGWASHARFFRAAALTLREQPFVEAAGALGIGRGRLIGRHLLPNLLPGALIVGTFDVASVQLSVASLSFLGLGAQPPAADWGVMLSEGRPFLAQAPLLVFVPRSRRHWADAIEIEGA